MSGLIDPRTGKQIQNQNQAASKLTMQDVHTALLAHRYELENIRKTMLQQALYTEWLTNKILLAGIELPQEEFPEWAEKRFQEIQQESLEIQKEFERKKAEALQAAREQENQREIDLDE